MSAHTVGPWRYDYMDGYCGEIVAADGQTVATFADEPGEKDARLIAAAPELLESLKEMLCMPREDDAESTAERICRIGRARAAINKATGETS